MHPMSGAGSIKNDGSDDEAEYEVKDANKTFTLKASELEAARKYAARNGKEAVWLIKFKELPGWIVELRMDRE